MCIGYARVSSRTQDTAAQRAALERAGAKVIVEEQRSGAASRPLLEQLLADLRPGQTVLVYKVDRLARNLADLLRILAAIRAKGALFRSLTEPIDTSTAIGELLLQVLGAVAQLERSMIRERCAFGRAQAMADGVQFGRAPMIERSQVLALRAAGHTWDEVCKILGCNRSTAKRTAAGIRRCDGGPGEHRLRMRKRTP